MIPFNMRLVADRQTQDYDKFFGPCAVTVSSYQIGLQIVLEALGARAQTVPVIMPVTSSPQTLAGVLRSGAHPILLDIEQDTWQMSPKLVQEILGELTEGAVILLNRPNGMAVDPELFEVTKGFPTIEDSRILPHPNVEVGAATFTLFDLSMVIKDGGVIVQPHQDMINTLKWLRSSPMGHSAQLLRADDIVYFCNSTIVEAAYGSFKQRVSEYKEKLSEYGVCDKLPQNNTDFPTYVICKSENAGKDIANLHAFGVEAKFGVFGLHHLPEVQERYTEIPEYPNADAIQNSTIALTLNQHMSVIDTVKKVLNDKA